jgi:hypothetical protein
MAEEHLFPIVNLINYRDRNYRFAYIFAKKYCWKKNKKRRLQHRKLMNNAYAPLTIIGEPTGLVPCTAHYGYLECRLLSEGLRSHAGME